MRSTDTVFFKHKHITNPTVTPADAIINAAKDITAALRGDVSGPLGAKSLDDLKKMEEISPPNSKQLHKIKRSGDATSKGERGSGKTTKGGNPNRITTKQHHRKKYQS